MEKWLAVNGQTRWVNKLKIVLISSFVPKKCGIATYSRDLINGIEKSHNVDWRLVAAEDNKESYAYDGKNVAVLKKDSLASYIAAADAVNKWKPDIVLFEHEYGLYGGDWVDFVSKGKKRHDPTGNYALELINKITAPVVTTLHTVVSEPDETRREIMRAVSKRSSAVIAMTKDTANILKRDYGISGSHISVIPHGVPEVVDKDKESVLRSINLNTDRFYLLITGLIGPNKQIDLVIKALPAILEKHPKVMLIVAGQTHPDILAADGEKYRESLLRLAKKLGVCDSLIFVNEYLELSTLVKYMSIADIYLTIHKDPEQAASGTLAYALGCGLLSVSTPYRYAKEVLSDGRGFLVPFNSPRAIADKVNSLIEDPKLQKNTRQKAVELGKKMSWPIVGKSYVDLFNDILDKRSSEYKIL